MSTVEAETNPPASKRRGMPARRWAATCAAVIVLPVTVIGTVVAPAAMETTTASAAVPLLAGSKWLSGRGVPVLPGRQCVELATRMYTAKHWGNLSDIYNTRHGRPYDHGKLTFHRNNSGYVPVPGDVLVELGGWNQHVAVVDRVVGRAIYTVEQNATPSGRHVYGWNGRFATGAYGPRHVGGFIHSVKNTQKN
ncbi:MAG: CHAP domain-containing protein [Actinomycetes bacterium]